MDEPQERTGGSVPNDWGNALARRWAPDLPRPLAGPTLRMLYALRTLASADGALRYRDGKGIPLGEIAAACRSDEKDVRRYLTAAIAAGIVGTIGKPKRGKATIYALILTPWPNWAAAVAVLANSERPPGAEPAPWSSTGPSYSVLPAGSSRRGDLNPSPETEFGGPRPELIEHGSGVRDCNSPERSSGDRDPAEFGGPRPVDIGGPRLHHPGTTKSNQEMGEVVPQPEDVRAYAHPADAPSETAAAPLQTAPDPPPGARAPRPRMQTVPDGQVPLLLSVHDTGTELTERGQITVAVADVQTQGWRAATGWRPTDATGT